MKDSLIPKDTCNDIRFIATSYIKQGAYNLAIDLFSGLTELEDHAYDLQTLGALYLEVGNYESALEYLNKALAKDPEHTASIMNKIEVLSYSNKKTEALSEAKNFLERCNDKNLQEKLRFIISNLEEK